MTQRARLHVRSALAVLMAVMLLFDAPPARASLFGEENATLGAILGEDIAQLAEMVKTVAGIAQQITQLKTIITQGETVLRSVADAKSAGDLLGIAQRTQGLVQSVDKDVKLLKYKLSTIDSERKQLFPTLNDVPTSEFTTKAHAWHDALRESGAVAFRAQTSVETLQKRMDRMEALLSAADNATGVVETLQLVVRGLALLHTDLESIETNVAAGQRVTATWASIDAAEAERSEVIHQRMLDGYTNRGAPPQLLRALP